MAAIRKRGKRWYAEVRMQGIQRGKSFDTKAEALAWAVDTERRIKAGQGTDVAGRTMADLFDRYSREVSSRKPSKEWEQRRLLYLSRDPIAAIRVAEFGPPQVTEWRERRRSEVSDSTVRRDMALLSHVCRVAVREWRWMDRSPVSDVTRPMDGPPRDRVATDEEIAMLVHVAGEDMRTIQGRTVAAFRFAVETAMRSGEICALRREDCRGDHVVLPRTKNGTKREVPLSAEARRLLEAVADQGMDPVFGLKTSQRESLWRKVSGKAGLRGLRFHDARHTAITRLSRKLDVLDLARMVGHRDLSQLLTYYNPTATEIAKRL